MGGASGSGGRGGSGGSAPIDPGRLAVPGAPGTGGAPGPGVTPAVPPDAGAPDAPEPDAAPPPPVDLPARHAPAAAQPGARAGRALAARRGDGQRRARQLAGPEPRRHHQHPDRRLAGDGPAEARSSSRPPAAPSPRSRTTKRFAPREGLSVTLWANATSWTATQRLLDQGRGHGRSTACASRATGCCSCCAWKTGPRCACRRRLRPPAASSTWRAPTTASRPSSTSTAVGGGDGRARRAVVWGWPTSSWPAARPGARHRVLLRPARRHRHLRPRPQRRPRCACCS